MSFDKLHKWWNRQSAIVVVYVVVMQLPNVLLAITEPYSFTTVTASLLMPGAVYLLLAVALKRPGLLMLCSFPLMVLGAFQIVLLYLFGGSIIAVDMFTNLFTTNASEAGELLGNIWPSIVFVIVLYVPLIVLAVRSLLLSRRGFSGSVVEPARLPETDYAHARAPRRGRPVRRYADPVQRDA